MKRNLVLGTGFMALVTPVLYLYVLLAAPGPAQAITAVLPVTRTLVVAAIASFLLGWVTIATLSLPDLLDTPQPAAERWKASAGCHGAGCAFIQAGWRDVTRHLFARRHVNHRAVASTSLH